MSRLVKTIARYIIRIFLVLDQNEPRVQLHSILPRLKTQVFTEACLFCHHVCFLVLWCCYVTPCITSCHFIDFMTLLWLVLILILIDGKFIMLKGRKWKTGKTLGHLTASSPFFFASSLIDLNADEFPSEIKTPNLRYKIKEFTLDHHQHRILCKFWWTAPSG